MPTMVGLAILTAFWPVWRWFILRLDDGSDEPMGVVALAAAGWFLWQERSRLGCSRGSIRLASAGLATYALVFPLLPPMIRALAAIVLLGGAFRLDRASPGIWILLTLSLPVVATAQFYAGWPLRVATAFGATEILQIFGVEVVREGTVIRWGTVHVAVDAPCSGVRMLWTGLFFHGLLAANHRLSLRTLVWMTPFVITIILLANVLRAALLFFKESGWIPLPEWTHQGIGLAVFALMLAIFAPVHRRGAGSTTIQEPDLASRHLPGRGDLAIFAVAAILAALAPNQSSAAATSSASTAAAFPGWPSQWDGIDLEPMPLSDVESDFAADFPGRLAVFQTQEGPRSRRIILRWVNQPTRKLHSSSDCLRASGFAVKEEPDVLSGSKPERWATWSAYHPDLGPFLVRERIYEATGNLTAAQWTEVSRWFWSASLGRSSGPWWAVTILEPTLDEN
jgi:exosortase/archaeosortase family protein